MNPITPISKVMLLQARQKQRDGESRETSNKPMPLMKMPTLSSLTIAAIPHDEDDDLEENKLMTMLMQLKSTKEAINQNKKRKQYQKTVEEKQQHFHEQVQSMIAKYSEKHKSTMTSLQSRLTKLKSEYAERCREAQSCENTIQTSVEKHEKALHGHIDSLRKMESIVAKAQKSAQHQTEEETSLAAEQLSMKVNELQIALKTCAIEANKEDRFSATIESIIATL